MNIRRSKSWARGAVIALSLPLVLTGFAGPANAATSPAGAYAEAYGLLVDLTALTGAIPVSLPIQADASSSCPPPGGTKTAQLLGVGDPAAARADVLNSTATTDCVAKKATATENVVNVDALGAAAPIKVHADAITSTSTTTCSSKPTGSTKIVNLSIGGNVIPVPTDVPPNTTLSLDPIYNLIGVKIILNEQHPASLGRGLVVNGVHIIASGFGTLPVGGSIIRGDVVIAHAVSGVVCPGGPGTDNGGLPKPDISFSKSASPSVAEAGDTVTYTAQVTNQSTTPCEVLKFVDHVAPAFTIVSSSGPLGTKLQTPAPSRLDGGSDAVLRPTGVTIGAGKSLTQTFVVKVKDGATPGTYYDTLEIYCGPNGDFVSGPLAPVTVTTPGVPVEPPVPPTVPPTTPVDFKPTGGSPALAATALLALVAAVGLRRLRPTR